MGISIKKQPERKNNIAIGKSIVRKAIKLEKQGKLELKNPRNSNVEREPLLAQ